MLNSGETREIVTLKALEILIMVDKDYNTLYYKDQQRITKEQE